MWFFFFLRGMKQKGKETDLKLLGFEILAEKIFSKKKKLKKNVGWEFKTFASFALFKHP